MKSKFGLLARVRVFDSCSTQALSTTKPKNLLPCRHFGGHFAFMLAMDPYCENQGATFFKPLNINSLDIPTTPQRNTYPQKQQHILDFKILRHSHGGYEDNAQKTRVPSWLRVIAK